MSLSHTNGAYEMSGENVDRKRHGYGFILALVCFGLALLVFSAIFTPVPIGSRLADETLVIGP
jgi:hypothetical protein